MKTIGPYQLTEFIDAGSFANVYKCINTNTNETFACKVVNLSIKQYPKLLENFKNELYVHSSMCHPGIIQVHDIQVDDKYIYIFLEYSTYGNLEQVIQASELTEIEAMVYFKQIMEAIKYIHNLGVAHRDITLKNILITDDGSAKLSDFGLCKLQPENSYLSTTCGTFIYVPPEILEEKQYDGMKADIWSAGICLYALTSRHFPWIIDDNIAPEKIWETTKEQICSGDINFDENQSDLLRDLLSQMLSVDPEFRPSADEVLEHPWFSPISEYETALISKPNQSLIDTAQTLVENL